MSETPTVSPDPPQENSAADTQSGTQSVSESGIPPDSQNEAAGGMTATVKTVLEDHKGKLAIGAAATLGLMVYYKWREKRLAKEDPEEYARLQRLKAVMRTDERETYRDAEPQGDAPQFPDRNPMP